MEMQDYRQPLVGLITSMAQARKEGDEAAAERVFEDFHALFPSVHQDSAIEISERPTWDEAQEALRQFAIEAGEFASSQVASLIMASTDVSLWFLDRLVESSGKPAEDHLQELAVELAEAERDDDTA